MSLSEWGWNGSILCEAGLAPARVIIVHGQSYVVQTGVEELEVELSGRLQYGAASAAELPAIGDWVLLRHGIVDQVLPRRTLLSRKWPGGATEQVLAANIDVVFIVSGLDGDLNLRRLERYLVVALESGARPVFVLNKSDVLASAKEVVREVQAIACGRDVLLTSAERGEGIDSLRQRVPAGVTGTLIGSSGAGKSTLINRLLGVEAQAVREVLSDSRGRHTTTYRQLFRIPECGMLIDQPGLREIQLWAGEEALAGAFDDVTELASQCRFRDCRHEREPGCAVRAAVESGALATERLHSFGKLRREIEWASEDVLAAVKRKQLHKNLTKAMRRMTKNRD